MCSLLIVFKVDSVVELYLLMTVLLTQISLHFKIICNGLKLELSHLWARAKFSCGEAPKCHWYNVSGLLHVLHFF